MGTITDKDITICGHGSKTPSTKNLYTYSETRYNQYASNKKRKGIVAVRRFKALTDKGRTKCHDLYKTIIGRNSYSQSLRQYVYKPYKNGKYYSDCSSSGMATLEKAGYDVGDPDWYANTAEIYNNDDLFEDVPVKIKSGHITNPEVLCVFDAILFRGNDPDRPKQIGHVEWVYAVPASQTTTTPTTTTTKTKKKYSKKFPTLPERGYFKYGDGMGTMKELKDEVKLMQKLVNWLTGDKIDTDGEFGKVTKASVKRAQKLLGVTVDGKFGKKTLDAAKAYKK